MQDESLCANTAFFENDSTASEDASDNGEACPVGSILNHQVLDELNSTGEEEEDENLEECPGDMGIDVDQSKYRPAYCIFVASLSATRSDDELCLSVRAHFSQYGQIINVKVLRDPKNRPYAFVQYDNEKDADRALSLGHRTIIHDRQVRCERARVNRTILICSNRPAERVSFRKATELGARYGEVEHVASYQGPPGGGMFVQFAYRDDAAKAYMGLQRETTFGVYWVQNVTSSKGSKTSVDSRQLYVGQLPRNITEEELQTKFGKFGKVLDIEVIRKPHNNDAIAFIQFDSFLSAVQAIERMNHTLWMDRTIHVRCREIRQVQPQFAPVPSYARAVMGDENYKPLRFGKSAGEFRHNKPPKPYKGKENKVTGAKNNNPGMYVRHPNEPFYPMYYVQPQWGVYPPRHPQEHPPGREWR